MSHSNERFLAVAVFLLAACAVQVARATEAPADVCSLLPAADVSKTLGKTYGSPDKKVAPRPFRNTVEGTDCTYHAAQSMLLFRAYFDPSPSAATELFAKLSRYYGTPTPIAGVADEAYFDKDHGAHVRKGNVRFFINLSPIGTFTPAIEKELTDLAALVSGRL
jgi:hypothetical protein